MEKVKLPQEVAKAIESYSEWGKETLFQEIVGLNRIHPETKQVELLNDYFIKTGWLFLAEALVNGYEVEQTPEEKVREYYRSQFDEATAYARGVCLGIKETLDLFNIKIPGVNTE